MEDKKINTSEQLPKQDKIDFAYMFLFSGNDFKVGEFVIKHPTIKDILNIQGTLNHEEIYWSMVATLLSDPYESMVQLDDAGLDYEKVTSFELFCMNWNNQVKIYEENKDVFDKEKFHPLMIIKRALSFFLGEHNWDLLELFDGKYILYDVDDNNYQIDEDTFHLIGEYIKAINCIEYKDRVKPKNKFVKQALIEDMREEQQIKKNNPQIKDEKINILGSMMSAVCVGGNGSISPTSVLDLSIFQLYQYFILEQKKMRVDKLMNGIYAGTIDSKSIKQDDFKWTV